MNSIWMNAIRAAAGAGGSFIGPGDGLSNIAAVYAVRRWLSAYTGSLIRLRRDSDNDELDFGYVANGDLDVSAIATWLGGGSGYVATWYDQSGNARDVVQATADNQPLYVASGPNSKPTVRFDGTNDRLRITFSNVATPHHIFFVLKQVSWTDGDIAFDGGALLEIGAIQTGGSGRLPMYTGGLGPALLFGTSAYRLGTFYYSTTAAAHYVRLDGASQTSNGSTVGKANVSGVTLGCRSDQVSFANVDISEWVMFSAAQTNAPIEQNMGTYYGISVP